MDAISRRRALALVATSAASVAAPLAASAASAEHPGDRVVRLMKELRDALAHPDGWGGQFMAEVYPLGTPGSIMLTDIRHRAEQDEKNRFARRFHAMVTEGAVRERALFHGREMDQALKEAGLRLPHSDLFEDLALGFIEKAERMP